MGMNVTLSTAEARLVEFIGAMGRERIEHKMYRVHFGSYREE
jgi:hypothetical protein